MITQEDIYKKTLIFTLRIAILRDQWLILIELLQLKCSIEPINHLSKVILTDLRSQVSSMIELQMQNSSTWLWR